MNFFDLHCDTPYECYKRDNAFFDGDNAVSIKKGAAFDRWCQVCAVWIPDDCNEPKKRYRDIVSHFKNQVTLMQDKSELEKERSFILSLEGGACIESVDDVDRLYRDGVRIITLTWNGRNALAGGVNTDAPLTELGRAVIRRMNALSIAVDVSHLNDRCFDEVVSLADKVVATHVCCRSIHPVKRNLTDEQIRKLVAKKGLIGICFYPKFLGERDVFSDFKKHLLHLLSLECEDFLAVGSDFDGAEMSKKLDSIDKVPHLYDYLVGQNINKTILRKLFYDNAYKFFKEF